MKIRVFHIYGATVSFAIILQGASHIFTWTTNLPGNLSDDTDGNWSDDISDLCGDLGREDVWSNSTCLL